MIIINIIIIILSSLSSSRTMAVSSNYNWGEMYRDGLGVYWKQMTVVCYVIL